MTTFTLISYIIYLIFTLSITIWVGGTLYRNGRTFLMEAFHEEAEKADSVNHLLKVGFYLLNIGFLLLFLTFGEKPESVISMIEQLSLKIGFALLFLGGMHFFNMFNFEKMRKKANRSTTLSSQS